MQCIQVCLPARFTLYLSKVCTFKSFTYSKFSGSAMEFLICGFKQGIEQDSEEFPKLFFFRHNLAC